MDRENIKAVLAQIDRLLLEVIPDNAIREKVQSLLLGPAKAELSAVFLESRAPILQVVGRSGHGKSALINALVGRTVAEVGDLRPTTPVSSVYDVSFEESNVHWAIVDSRGFFETTRPEGAEARDPVQVLMDDIVRYRPDVLLHVISAPEIRSMSKDIDTLRQVLESAKRATGAAPPVVVVLTKVDTLNPPRVWPPEEASAKAMSISKAVRYAAEAFGAGETNQLAESDFQGCRTSSERLAAVIPVYTYPEPEEPYWNLETLKGFIGDTLPRSAQYHFAIACREVALLRRLTDSLISRFSTIAGTIGVSPLPIADAFLLYPLQVFLVTLIGVLAGREPSLETAKEFLAAGGVTGAIGIGGRFLAQQIVKVVPAAGDVASGFIAGSSMTLLGKSAQKFFLDAIQPSFDEVKGSQVGAQA